MKKFTVSICLLLLTGTATFVNAQAPILQAENSFGGSDNDHAFSIQQTKDGGFIMAGETASNNGNVSGNHGDEDFWVVKLNKNGSIKWQKALGGLEDEAAFSVQETNDGGFIVAGEASFSSGQVTGNHGTLDFWIVKLDINGNLLWQKSLGGSQRDFANSLQQTTDGGYIVAGGSFSNDGDVTVHHGPNIYADYWIVKLDANGNMQWQKSYGGSKGDIAMSVRQVNDGGYIVAGNSASGDGDVRDVHDFVYGDFWILKLDTQGNMQWQKAFGGSDYEQANSILQTTDGGYVAAGWNRSPNNGNVTGNHGNYDFWIVKMSSLGNLQWQKSLGGSEGDLAYSIQQTPDNGYVVAGGTSSNNADVSGNHGKEDFWVVKIGANGNLQWQKTLGGSEYEEARGIGLTKDGGYIIAGHSGFVNVNNGDVTGNHGNYDFWVAKLSSTGSIALINNSIPREEKLSALPSSIRLRLSPNPASAFINVDIESLHEDGALSIMNSEGEIMMKKNLEKNKGNYHQQIGINTFLPGVYYISVKSGNEIVSRQFIKE